MKIYLYSPTPDVDGLCSSYIMYDYLKNKLEYDSVKLFWNERSQGHGIEIGKDKVPPNTDLLLLIDSSTSDSDACKELSKSMDIIIIDHHQPERENPYALIVNPQLQEYENKDSSATLLTFKFVELLDNHYRKANIRDYIDVTGMSLLSDQMNMRVLENRWFVYQALSNVKNVGLLALVHETRNGNKKLNSQIFNFDLIPCLNTVARNDELKKGLMLLLEKDFFKARKMARQLVEQNKLRKEKVKNLVKEYMEIIQDEKFALIVSKNSSKGYNGLVASKLADTLKKPCLVLKDNGDHYQGSGRSYGDFPMQSFVKNSNLIEYAAGHEPAFGFSIKAENWDKFKQYVNDDIDESLFEPVIEYDIELNEDELDWDMVNEIESLDIVWGNSYGKIIVKLNNVFVEDKELFPKQKKEHVKIKASNLDIMKFNDPEYASDVDSWDNISVIGSVGVNDFGKEKRIQVFIEDYIKE